MLTDDDLAAARRHHYAMFDAGICLCHPAGGKCDARKLLDEVDRLRALLDPASWREDRNTAFIHGLEAVGASDESIAVARKAVQP